MASSSARGPDLERAAPTVRGAWRSNVGVFGRIGGVERPVQRDIPSLDSKDVVDRRLEPGAFPLGWDFEAGPATTSYRRQPPVPGVVYAELPLRAAAFLIDLTLVGVVGGILSPAAQQLVDAVLSADAAFLGITARTALEFQVLPILIHAGSSAVVAVWFWLRFRATPGQMMLGLFTVTRTEGLPLGRSQALLRWLLLFGPATILTGSGSAALLYLRAAVAEGDARGANLVAATITVVALAWYGLLAASIAGDRRGRGLHDKLAGSVVVRRDGSPS